MKIEDNLYEYWIHKYEFSSSNKRKQFKALLKEERVWLSKNKEYNSKQHFIYRSKKPIKVVVG